MSTVAEQELPAVVNDSCSQCEEKEFLLAVDLTEYESYSRKNGSWVYGSSSTEKSSAEKSVRFYCANCGTYHQVPEGVQI